MKRKIIMFATISLLLISLTGCTWWNDRVKTFQSNTVGLRRDVYVYSYTGQLLKTYSGNVVRIENDLTGTIIQLDNKRIVVENATVISEEK